MPHLITSAVLIFASCVAVVPEPTSYWHLMAQGLAQGVSHSEHAQERPNWPRRSLANTRNHGMPAASLPDWLTVGAAQFSTPEKTPVAPTTRGLANVPPAVPLDPRALSRPHKPKARRADSLTSSDDSGQSGDEMSKRLNFDSVASPFSRKSGSPKLIVDANSPFSSRLGHLKGV